MPARSGCGGVLYLGLGYVQTYCLASSRCWWIPYSSSTDATALSHGLRTQTENFDVLQGQDESFHEHSQREMQLQGYSTGQGAVQVLCRSRKPLWGICFRRQLIEKKSRTRVTWGDPGSLYLAGPKRSNVCARRSQPMGVDINGALSRLALGQSERQGVCFRSWQAL